MFAKTISSNSNLLRHQMTIQDLGSIGEFVSAVIIIVTLIYIAIQSKQTQNLLRSSSFQERTSTAIEVYRDIAVSGDLAQILTKNAFEQDLTADEQTRLRFWHLCVLKASENVHYQIHIGVLEDEYESTLDESVLNSIKNVPGLRDTWEDQKAQFGKSFQKYIDERLSA